MKSGGNESILDVLAQEGDLGEDFVDKSVAPKKARFQVSEDPCCSTSDTDASVQPRRKVNRVSRNRLKMTSESDASVPERNTGRTRYPINIYLI